ncbi:MAG: iron-containing alcohol dehydrogenase [Candidatus Omnitrophota bacterium]
MLNFKYHIPTIIYFGKGEIEKLSSELSSRAKNILIVTGQGSIKKYGILDDVLNEVKKARVKSFELSGIKPNPRLASVYEGIKICQENNIDLVLAVGGGSVIDASKAIAAGVKYNGDVWDLFLGKGQIGDALPVASVLTLAATGSEMNGNSVVTREDRKQKLVISHPKLRPVFSILDPEYTYSVNEFHTAAGIADIMTHIFEQYFSHTKSAFVQDRVAESLLRVCIKYGPIVCKEPENYEARANILWASSLALNGLLGYGKLCDWACHGIEHELSARYDISHGAGLAVIVPNWMEYILSENTVEKFFEYGVGVWGIESKKDKRWVALEAIKTTRKFFSFLDLPTRLRDFDVKLDSAADVAKGVFSSWGEAGSFKKLSIDDVEKILEMCS